MLTPMTSQQILDKVLAESIAPLPSQAGYAKALAEIFSLHLRKNILMDDGFSPDELPSLAALVVAPTGQGKTFLLRKMAECLGINLITVDCSTLVAENYKGVSLSQRLAAAMEEAKSERTFSQSVLFFDELDKLVNRGEGSGMTSILQLFNSGSVAVESKKAGVRHISISRFTVLFGGAFEGLDKIVEQRIRPGATVGFGCERAQKLSKAELLLRTTTADLTKFGLMPELLGRIGTILTIPPLELEDYRQLLTAEAGSLRRKYQNYLWELFGVNFEIAPGGVEVIAQKCMSESTGARAINPIVNDLMRRAISAVESENTICKVILDSNEDGCFARYEHGTRGYCFRNEQAQSIEEELPVHLVKAKNVPAMVRKLCRYYRNAEGDLTVLPQLEAFLDCAITYLFLKCRPSEFTFVSLEKFARATTRPGPNRPSPFDIIVDDAKRIFSKDQLNAFDKVYDPWMSKNLASAMRRIMEYIRKNHGPCQVKFHIPKQRRWERKM